MKTTATFTEGMTKSQRRMSERDREKVMKRAHCVQSAHMSLSFRPCWIPAIQMTGVHRPSLQRVSPSPSQQQLPFMRLCWLWGHLLHTALMKHTHTHIYVYTDTHTHTHSKLLQLNASWENQRGIRDGRCLRTPMRSFVWMRPKGGEVPATTGCRRGQHIAWPIRVCHDTWRLGWVTNQKFATRTPPWRSSQAFYTTVTWVGQVTFELMELFYM